jgi:hypothetical protein
MVHEALGEEKPTLQGTPPLSSAAVSRHGIGNGNKRPPSKPAEQPGPPATLHSQPCAILTYATSMTAQLARVIVSIGVNRWKVGLEPGAELQ